MSNHLTLDFGQSIILNKFRTAHFSGHHHFLKSAPNIIDITLSSQQLFMNQLVKHRIKDNLVVIDENLTHNSAPYVGLDNATICARKILKGNASQSSKVALGKTEVLAFFDETAISPIFYEGKYKKQSI